MTAVSLDKYCHFIRCYTAKGLKSFTSCGHSTVKHISASVTWLDWFLTLSFRKTVLRYSAIWRVASFLCSYVDIVVKNIIKNKLSMLSCLPIKKLYCTTSLCILHICGHTWLFKLIVSLPQGMITWVTCFLIVNVACKWIIQFKLSWLTSFFNVCLANVHNKCDIEIQNNINFSILNKIYSK